MVKVLVSLCIHTVVLSVCYQETLELTESKIGSNVQNYPSSSSSLFTLQEKLGTFEGSQYDKKMPAESDTKPSSIAKSETDVQRPSSSTGTNVRQEVRESDGDTTSICVLNDLKTREVTKKSGATFWLAGWRSKLCTCSNCKVMPPL